MDKNDDIWIVNPREYEDQCECVKSRASYIYTYPFVVEVWKAGAKIITRTGKTVKNVRVDGTAVTGELDGKWHIWDVAGRYDGPYKDSPLDLRICERYFYKNWRDNFKMSNAEWSLHFGVKHPKVKLPETNVDFEMYDSIQEDPLYGIEI